MLKALSYALLSPPHPASSKVILERVGAKGEGEGVGWIGNLGLIDANYCLWNG